MIPLRPYTPPQDAQPYDPATGDPTMDLPSDVRELVPVTHKCGHRGEKYGKPGYSVTVKTLRAMKAAAASVECDRCRMVRRERN